VPGEVRLLFFQPFLFPALLTDLPSVVESGRMVCPDVNLLGTILVPSATTKVARPASDEFPVVNRTRAVIVHYGQLPLFVAATDGNFNGRVAGAHRYLTPLVEQGRRVALQATGRIERPPGVVHHPVTLGGFTITKLHTGPVAGRERMR